MAATYIHLPFCVQLCPYCDFCKTDDVGSGLIGRYLAELGKEIEKKGPFSPASSIYFGGGTPSRLSLRHLQQLYTMVKQSGLLLTEGKNRTKEITMEIDPCTLTPGKLAFLKAQSVNRASVGVQTFNDKQLKSLGRIHSSKDAIQTIQEISAIGIENISLDLIIGLPNISTQDIKNNIAILADLPITHTSMYILSIEPGTPYATAQKNKQLELPEDDLVKSHYDTLITGLDDIGLKQYEISNFARPGFESSHNQAYWSYQPYEGLGASATSFDGATRFKNTNDIHAYTKQWDHDRKVESLDLLTQSREKAMLALRTNKGLKQSSDSSPKLSNALDKLVDQGYLNLKNAYYQIPPQYFSVSNAILEELF